MSTIEPKDGFSVTPSRISFVLGLIALLGVMWQAVSYAEDQKHRIAAVESYIVEDKQLSKDMLAEIRRLSEASSKLDRPSQPIGRGGYVSIS